MTASFSYTLGTTAVVAAVIDSADGEIVPIVDVCADGLSVLISEYLNSPRLQSFICALLTPVQELEDTVNDLLTLVLDIDVAEGTQLEIIGAIVGEPRGGRADVDYRRGLRTRVRVNRSEGKFSDFFKIVSFWVGSETTVDITEHFPASLFIETLSYADDPNGLFARLDQAKAAGVNLQLIYGADETTLFSLSETYDTLETSATTGLGSTHTSTGGVFAGVLG